MRWATAEAGEEGLYKAERNDYDAILLDVILPRLDGWEILERLRRQKQTPILMLTARDGLKDRVQGLDAGADDYFVKPSDLSELLAQLRVIIRRAAGRALSHLALRNVVIDTRARTVLKPGQSITLTAREYAILKHLVLHRGEVGTRTVLYEHLLDEIDDSLSNLVDVHVFSIRKKISHDSIAARRGQRYCLEA